MMILGEKRKELINNLKLNSALRGLTDGKYVHDELEFRCLELKYSLEPEGFFPGGLDVVPLWESDLSITGFYLDENEQPIFIHYYVEEMDDYKVIGNTISDLVDYLVKEYVEYKYEDEVRNLLLKQEQ